MGKSAYNWDIYKNRRDALLELKRSLTWVDTILETEDGTAHEFVHSQVISAFGDKLYQFIYANGHYVDWPATMAATSCTGPSRTRNKLKLIKLPKLNRYTLGILVECAYTGLIKTDLASGGIWEVLDFADHYEMVEVIRACCSFLVKNLSRSNCVQFYHIGIRHRHTLQRSAWHKIRANFKHILNSNLRRLESAWRPPSLQQSSAGQQQLQQALAAANEEQQEQQQVQQQQQLQRPSDEDIEELERRMNNLATIKYEHFEALLMHDKLNVDNEESVWYAIKLWCNYKLAERAERVTNLLPCMRFPRFRQGTEFSARSIWRDPLILNNTAAQHQLAVLDRNHRDYLQAATVATSSGGGLPAAAAAPQRDGFALPCALQPRQLRPRVPHSILLAIGGWQQGTPTTLIESYDVNCNMWFESPKRIMSPLAYHGVECINGLLYICGGTDGSEILNEVFTFDPIRGDCQQRASMREARCYVSTATQGAHLYAMGGHNGHQRMRSVERLEHAGGQAWEHIRDMNVARSDASACVHDRCIYIAGGLNDQLIESSVEFYNRQDDTWTFAASMQTPRTSFTMLLFQGCLLAIGGNNGQERLASVEQYSFASKLWSRHSEMRHRRSTFSAALVDESKLIVVGGYNGQTPFNQVEMFDEQRREWVLLHKIRYDRSGLRAVVVNDLANASEYTFLGRSQQSGGQQQQAAIGHSSAGASWPR